MRRVIISEEQEKVLIKKLNEDTYQMPVPKKTGKPYTVNPEKVLIVKKYLDNNFKKGFAEFVGNNGYVNKIRVISMPDSNGESLRDIDVTTLNDLLIAKFKNMFSNHEERKVFINQVVKDWLNDKITVLGGLSVNSL